MDQLQWLLGPFATPDWRWWFLGPFVGAIFGSIVIFILQWLRGWWIRPILTINQSAPGREVPADEFDSQKVISANRHYARLFVYNKGRTTAQDVQVIVTNRETIKTEVFDAPWSRQADAIKMHVPSKIGRYVDLCYTRRSVLPGSKVELWLSVVDVINYAVKPATDLNFEIAIAASNAETVKRRVIMTPRRQFRGASGELPQMVVFQASQGITV